MPETLLSKGPLVNVVCEVRFDAPRRNPDDTMVDLASAMAEVGLTEFANDEAVQMSVGPAGVQQTQFRRHRFSTPDGLRTAVIDKEIFTYETPSYSTGIEGFLDAWQLVARALAESDGERPRARIGLRYVNEVRLPGSDFDAVACAVRPELLAPWQGHERLANLSVSLQELRFRQDEGELTVRHGLQRSPTGTAVYILDFDHYEQRLRHFDVDEELVRLRRYNDTVYEIFRWVITDEQYAKFAPEAA